MFLYSKQLESLISQKWPLVALGKVRMKGRGEPRSWKGKGMINSEATNIKTKAI